MTITICISTRKRPDGLKRVLDSIDQIEKPTGMDISIVVVENDTYGPSGKIVEQYSNSGEFPVKYFLEPNLGIAYARNRSVKEAQDTDFCCFVDDDQIVDKQWLIELLKCQREFNADAVSGITPPIFEFEVPVFIRKYHNEDHGNYGDILSKAATGCLLIRKSTLDKIDGPFDHRLNFTGGEDFFMTHQATLIGAEIRINPKAISYEIIPKERTTVKYVFKRTYRVANTQMLVRSLSGEDLKLILMLPYIIGRLILGIVVLLPCWIFMKENKLLGIFKVSYALGQIMFILGRKNTFYKK